MDAAACAELGRRLQQNQNDQTFDASLFHPDATMWHNTDGHDAPFASRTEIQGRLRALVPDYRIADAVIDGFTDGWVSRHVVRGTLPDGGQLEMRVAVVGTVRDGKVARIQEYVDSAQVEPLRAAFRAAMAAAQDS